MSWWSRSRSAACIWRAGAACTPRSSLSSSSERRVIRLTAGRKDARYRRIAAGAANHAAPIAIRGAQKRARGPGVERDWPPILRLAESILGEDPRRVWQLGELAAAVHERITLTGSRTGFHFTLARKLVESGVAKNPATGQITLAGTPQPRGRAGRAPLRRIAPREPEPELDEAQPAPPTVTLTAATPAALDLLEENVERTRPFLGNFSNDERTAHLAAWAGRARQLQQLLGKNVDPGRFRRLFGKLTGITRELECGWIDALTPSWSTPDWDGYVAMNQAAATGGAPAVTEEQEREFHRGRLRGLLSPQRRVGEYAARKVLSAALEVLSENDPEVAQVIARFGAAPARKIAESNEKREGE